MADIIDFPVSPQEYFYDSRNLVDRGWKWHFGLPTPDAAGAVPLSTAECGAMPFRDDTAVSGLISDKCLRGEDWVFLDNWQDDRRWIYHHGFTNLFGDVPELSGELQTKGPSRGQLTAFAGNMSALCSVWRSDFQWTGGDRELHVSSYLDAWEELSAGFVDIPRLHDAELSDSSLKLSRMKNFFDDTSKFACTAFDPLVVMQDGGSDARQLWWWHYRYGQPAEQQSRFMQRVVFLVDDLYAGSAGPNRVVGFDVQVFAVVMGTTQSS